MTNAGDSLEERKCLSTQQVVRVSLTFVQIKLKRRKKLESKRKRKKKKSGADDPTQCETIDTNR